jgi:orotidine 5'-phosphate decarboxylase subfamily 2
MGETFAERLAGRLGDRGPLCVGIDPHSALLRQWGLSDDVTGLDRFAHTVVDALAPEVAVLKPQSAFFERHGSAGIAVLERVLRDARAAGAIVIADVKRGDIGSTAAGYADAYLDRRSPLAADAMTASPYLGYESLRPLLDAAAANEAGVIVLAATSNPEGATVQRAIGAGGLEVAQQMVNAAAADNADAVPFGHVGLVIGATVGDLGLDITALNGPILVPGLGAQGGTPADLRRLFGDRPGIIASASRSVLSAGPDPAALLAAARRHNDELRS